MTSLALIRHAETAWNAAGRIQGHADLPLSDEGRRQVAGWRLPSALDGSVWYTSPLARALETASLLSIPTPKPDDRLREMHWGRWEGRRLAELRAELGRTMARSEALGLDFRPPGGESPRDVQVRVASLMAEIASRGEPAGAVSHKGLIRAVVALALDWDMTDKAPIRFEWNMVYLFDLDTAGRPRTQLRKLPLEGTVLI